jgi:hypothetical protein
MDLFAGSATRSGVYDLSHPITQEGGKIKGRAASKHVSITVQMWEDHLAGKQPGVGVVPIRDDSTCLFGAFDIDVYPLDLQSIVNKLQNNDIPLIVCRSKSGGGHVYCFAQSPVPAVKMKNKLSEIASFLGFGGSEIFPKQSQASLDEDSIGNWLNGPYFGGVRGLRYALDRSGDALSPEAFLFAADALKVAPEWFDKPLVLVDSFPDGPPCLQTLVQIGLPVGSRNNGLYNIGVYLRRARPDAWEDELQKYNHQYLQPPLTVAEVGGVVKSLRRKDYFYSCSKQPIAAHCNASLCRTRKWGVGGGSSGRFPTLGQLYKLMVDPPLWRWEIDGVKIELSTEELLSAHLFQRKCLERLNLVLQVPSKQVWESAVHAAVSTVIVTEAPADASAEGQFFEMLEKFCLGRAQAQSLEEIVLGKPHTFEGRTYFRMQDLVGFLNRAKFFEFRTPKIAAILQEHGGQHHTKAFRVRTVQHWSMPAFARQTEGFEVPKNLSERKEAF